MTHTIALVAWLLSGLAFWIVCIICETPFRWRSGDGNVGWARAIFVELPLMLTLGPLLWVAAVYLRIRGVSRADIKHMPKDNK